MLALKRHIEKQYSHYSNCEIPEGASDIALTIVKEKSKAKLEVIKDVLSRLNEIEERMGNNGYKYNIGDMIEAHGFTGRILGIYYTKRCNDPCYRLYLVELIGEDVNVGVFCFAETNIRKLA